MIGFESTLSILKNSYHNQKLHHAILLNGKKGIGKASFAKKFVAEILNNKTALNPDLFLIEKDSSKKEIGVDKIRAIQDFTNHTSAISQNKFIILDSACELNKSSANALLKILEEPKNNSYLILISHNLNKILPTIRSRCYLLNIPNLSQANFVKILEENKLKFNSQDLIFLSEICDNSPADVISFGADLVRFYQLFLRSIINKKINDELIKKIADKNFNFQIVEKSCEFFLNRLIKSSRNFAMQFYFEEEKVFSNLNHRLSSEKIFMISDKSLDLLHKTNSLNLDKKLSFINIFNQICY